MFEDVCLVCGRLAEGLYCSDYCRDADAVQLDAATDFNIDLGFITDSIPPLVPASRRGNPEDPSTVSSPTSSILTTPSVTDDLDSEDLSAHSATAPGTVPHTSADQHHTAFDLLSTTAKQHPALIHNHSHNMGPPQMRSPRIQPVISSQTTLPFTRRPGNTNLHFPSQNAIHHPVSATATPSPSTSRHRRTASFNPVTGTPTAFEIHGSTATTHGHGHGHGHSSSSSRARHLDLPPSASRHSRSRSGHVSPAFPVADPDLPPLDELALEPESHRAIVQHPHPHSGGEKDVAFKEKARKKRARASLPAYFSNLMMGQHHSSGSGGLSSSKVPSTAVSSGTPSADEREEAKHPRTIRHVRSKSAMRASEAAKLSTSVSTFKQTPGGTRSNSGASLTVSVSSAKRVSPPATKSPTSPITPGTMSRRIDHLLIHHRGREGRATGERGRPGIRGGDPVLSPVTAVRHSDPGSIPTLSTLTSSGSPATSFAERHIRFIAKGGAVRPPTVSEHHHRLRSPPMVPSLPRSDEGEVEATFTTGRDGFTLLPPPSPTKTRRFSSPATSTLVPAAGGRVPASLLMSPAAPIPQFGGHHHRRASSPQPVPVVRRGWSPVRGRGAAVFEDDDEDEDADEEEEDEEEEEQPEERGRSKSRVRSRSRATRSRSREREGRRAFHQTVRRPIAAARF